MPIFRSDLGKGLGEPCSPYREAYVFGAELNSVKADNWNCLPEIVGETKSFDLSLISKNQEVVVALLNISDTPAGSCNFRWEWYRNRDNALLFSYDWSFSAIAGGWVYSYSYIGRVDWEINENGDYRVEVTVTGAISYKKIIQFSVSGVVEAIPEPTPSAGFFPSIVTALNTMSDLFYAAYVETYYWVWPFNYLADPFYNGSLLFSRLANDFNNFATAWYDVVDRITEMLSWSTIKSYILSWLPNLEGISIWFYTRWDWFLQQVNHWWSETSTTVVGWIDAAKDWTKLWIDYLQGEINELRIDLDNLIARIPDLTELLFWFSNWWGNILIRLHYWWAERKTEIQELIDTAFKIREDLWAGWQDWRDKVTEFFESPLDWLESKFTDWFLGAE